MGGGVSPGMCFSTFWLITVISPCVFDVFRITGFRYRWRERFPLEIYLSQRESRRSIPEERPGIEEPHASRARGMVPHASRARGTVVGIVEIDYMVYIVYIV